MNERGFVILMIASVVVIGSILICGIGLFMITNYNDTDRYDVSRDYTVSGTVTVDAVTYDCTGTGNSKPMKEAGNEHLYRFTFDISYSGSFEKELTFDLVCDKSGCPVDDLYDKISEEGDTSTWKRTVEGIAYEFTIGEYCKVTSMTMTGDGLSLNAELKE